MSRDVLHSWRDPRVQARFPHYRNLLDGKAVAFYKIAKSIAVPTIDATQSIDELVRMHDAARVLFKDEVARGQTPNDFEQTTVKANPSFLDLKVRLAKEYLKHCNFCENLCGVDRTRGQIGKCGMPAEACIFDAIRHEGEEPILVPSGCIFFYGCTFKCVFCANFEIAHEWRKKDLPPLGLQARSMWLKKPASWFNSPEDVADLVAELFKQKVKNINYVGGDPTSDLHVILEAMEHHDMNICLLWNSNFYNSAPALDLLLDVMDIWLPDWKYGNDACALKYSRAPNYMAIMQRNFQRINDEGSGEIIIRHLVMPGHVECCSKPALEWIARHLPKAVVNIMEQYHPAYHASEYPEINRLPTKEEIDAARRYATDLGIVWEPVTYTAAWNPNNRSWDVSDM
nr:radical SAM protein [Candidatus Sigynarchaeota archaeon]